MKLLKTATAIVLGLSFLTACSEKTLNEQEMQDTLKTAQTQLSERDSGKFNMSVDLVIDVPQLDNTEMNLSFNGKYENALSDQMGMAAEFMMSISGFSLQGQYYLKDQMAYVDFFGQKIKTPVDLSVAEMFEKPATIDFDMLSNWTYEKADGVIYIDCDINPDYFTSAFSELLEEATAISAKQSHCRYAIQNGELTQAVMTMDLEAEIDGETVGYTGTITVDWGQLANGETIDYPDFSDYIEGDTDLFTTLYQPHRVVCWDIFC